MKVKRRNIRKRYVHGMLIEAPDGRFAEVLRVDSFCNLWHTFFYSPLGHMWVIGHYEDSDTSRYRAIKRAMAYLEHNELPQGEIETPYLTKEPFREGVA